MRKKLFIGVLIATIVGVVAGSHLFNRTNAQDIPKLAEPAEKKSESNLFEVLQRALEAKKDVSVVPPTEGLPPPSAVGSPVTDSKPLVPPPSVPTPAVPRTVAPQDVVPAAYSGPVGTPKEAQQSGPMGAEPAAPKLAPPPSAPSVPAPAGVERGTPPVNTPQTLLLTPPANIAPMPPTPVAPTVPDKPAFTPAPNNPPPTAQVAPYQQPIAAQVAKIKDCPWSLQVDLVDGQTIVTATVNKKHEFRIVCKSLDLQTGKGTLKATGKVQIMGDMLAGSCEHLAISLFEDRLLLEGGAEVSIQKTPTNVSTDKPASFELKGEMLNLRISELQAPKLVQGISDLQSAKPIQANWQSGEALPMSRTVPAPQSRDGKQWTSYGVLRPAKLDLGGKEMAWTLQGNDGKVIAYLVARDGGSLSQYEGRTISVLGATEQINGRAMVRVSHIALP